MQKPTTIKLFLVKGSPDGLRTAEISNWSGLAIAGPRADLKAFRDRKELHAPGIYFLSGEDTETGRRTIYVGEAENVAKRVDQPDHRGKDFWYSAIGFVAKDNNLTKSHIRYLEGKLIDLGISLGITLANSKSSGASLPESDQADMDEFLVKILQLLPVLGLTSFDKPEQIEEESDQWLYCETKGLKGKGRRTNNGFLVVAGSQAVKEARPSAKYWKQRLAVLHDAGLFKDCGDHMKFVRDHEFGSPSAAGAVICGGATNGLTFWRDKNGSKLKDIEASEA